MYMWFWFFESRNSPSTAPLAAWFNGGPGCSSMIGLFQENGPCMFKNGASTPSLNPYSWNNYANMLYIDQPIGTGFSYGTNQVSSTVTAAPFVWTFLQAFYAAFPQYKSRDFGIFTESYGGHYGPQFASYIQSQNAKIAAGTATGEPINLVALGINNGWIDATLQYPAYVDFAANNSYRRIITSSEYRSYMSAFNSRCLPQLRRCTATTGQNSQCTAADDACYSAIFDPLTAEADFNVYDIRAPSNDPNPPQTYVRYLQTRSVMTAIGAQTTYQECPDAPYQKFVATGDDVRSFLSVLSSVVQSNVTVLLWAGDADFVCNWVGCLAAANAVQYSGSSAFASKAVTPYKVGGVTKGVYKTVGNLSWLKVYNAGHEVPFYGKCARPYTYVAMPISRSLLRRIAERSTDQGQLHGSCRLNGSQGPHRQHTRAS